MNWKSAATAAVVMCGIGFAAGRVYSQDAKDEPKPMTEEEKMKQFMEMAAPAEQHKKMAAHAGTWDAVMTMFEPGKDPQKFNGVSTTTACLNGLYFSTEYKGDMGGFPFEGRGFDGYSKEKKKYFTLWADSMGSTPLILWGTEEGKTITYDGELHECAMGNYTPRIKITHDDADHQTFEFWAKMAGAPDYVKMMEGKYTRKK